DTLVSPAAGQEYPAYRLILALLFRKLRRARPIHAAGRTAVITARNQPGTITPLNSTKTGPSIAAVPETRANPARAFGCGGRFSIARATSGFDAILSNSSRSPHRPCGASTVVRVLPTQSEAPSSCTLKASINMPVSVDSRKAATPMLPD